MSKAQLLRTIGLVAFAAATLFALTPAEARPLKLDCRFPTFAARPECMAKPKAGLPCGTPTLVARPECLAGAGSKGKTHGRPPRFERLHAALGGWGRFGR